MFKRILLGVQLVALAVMVVALVVTSINLWKLSQTTDHLQFVQAVNNDIATGNLKNVADTVTGIVGPMKEERLWYNTEEVHVRLTNLSQHPARIIKEIVTERSSNGDTQQAEILSTVLAGQSYDISVHPREFIEMVGEISDGHSVQFGAVQGKTVDWPIASLKHDPLFRDN